MRLDLEEHDFDIAYLTRLKNSGPNSLSRIIIKDLQAIEKSATQLYVITNSKGEITPGQRSRSNQ